MGQSPIRSFLHEACSADKVLSPSMHFALLLNGRLVPQMVLEHVLSLSHPPNSCPVTSFLSLHPPLVSSLRAGIVP